jgi:predicted nucleic acid-binding protein
MPFVVLYDANTLYPNALRDLCIRISLSGLVQAKWTQQIIEEMTGALTRNRGIQPAKLARLAELVNNSVPDCLVTGYEPLIEGLKLPDPDDRHVLAAAIKAGAQVIVTANLRDFPAAELASYDIEAKSPDDFVLDQISIDPRVVFSCVQEIANSRNAPPMSAEDVLRELERSGLLQSTALLRSPA